MPVSIRNTVLSALLACLAASAGAVQLDEAPARPGEWGYRPADGDTADMNPPAFVWRPVGDAAGYVLQVARDEAFENPAYTVETPWSSHAPDTALEPGAYFWRYAARGDDGAQSAWSTVRAFSVAADATVLPKPGPDEQARRLPETHPRLFLRPEEVPRYQDLADGTLAERWEKLRADADKLLENPPDTSEPPKYPEGIERKGEEWRRIWWGNRVHAINAADAAATLAFVWMLTGEEPYAEAARDILLAVMDWDPKGSTNYRYNDEAAMPLLYYPARAYTWLHGFLTEAERERVRAVMKVRATDCFEHLRGRRHLWRPYASHSNRAWHFLGEIGIAFHGELPEAADWLDYALTIFHTCYPVWGGDDGGWHEGVAYWRSYLARFMFWAAASDAALGINVFDKPFFSQTGYYALYTLPPGTAAGAFADQAILVDSRRCGPLMAQLAAGARNPHWQWYADAVNASLPGGYFGFLTAARAEGLESEPPDGLPVSRAFEDTGLAVLNTSLHDASDNVQVHFKSSPWGRQSHGYNANNTFLLHLRGERVFIRSGRRDIHGSPHHREWMWETKSDNAILVNGEGQMVHTPAATGRLAGFHTGARFDFVAGEAGESYAHLDRWSRRILFFKPHVIVIHDVLEAPEPSTYQWLLHASSAFEIGENAVRWEGEPGTVDVRMLRPAGLEITQTNEFDTPPHDWARFTLDEWHLSAATTTPAAKLDFVTVMRVDDAAAEAQLEGDTLTLDIGGERVVVTLAADAVRVDGYGVDYHCALP